MSVYLSPAYNFSNGGIYNINVATSTPFDPETGNDAFSTSITVNPNPPTPIITPPAPQICVGSPVQLSTQFIASPPPVTLPAVSSGTISVAVPDATAAGTSHIIPVTTVPAGASITAISVTLNMTHTWIGDMIINLKAPNGNVLNLINQKGGAGDNLVNTEISSASANPIPAAGAPYTGTYRADALAANPPTAFPQNVTSFAGLYSVGNGNWTLALRDNAGLDLGTLTSWSITITYQVLTPVITWTPVTGLYTNAGATTAYTGGNAFSLYANPAATTTYTVTATTAAGCTSSATARVTVNPIPVITIGSIPDTVCISDQVIPLVASPAGGSWSGTGVSGLNFIPPATAVGTYTLTYSYTSEFGCPATATKRIVVKDCPERMILLRDNAVILFPNPNSGNFFIRINSVLYNNLGMRVYANNGTLVRTQQFSGLAWGRVIPIDLTNLPGGLYMVKFYYEGGPRTSEKTFKVIIGTE
jgi:subtilisin-like proprotein convertase family protein